MVLKDSDLRNKKILVINTANIGDVVAGHVVIEALKPLSSQIFFVAREAFYGLMSGEPGVAELKIADAVTQSFDVVFDLDSSSDSRRLIRKIKAPLKIGRYTSWLRKLKYRGIYSVQVKKFGQGHFVRDYHNVIGLFGGEKKLKPKMNPAAVPSIIELFQKLRTQNKKVALMHFTSRAVLRTLPQEHVQMILQTLIDQGTAVVVVGTEKDLIESAIEPFAHQVKFLQGNWPELKTAASLCDFFVGADSGFMHLAASLGKPVFVFWGPTLSKNYGPLEGRKEFIEMDYSCRPCNQNKPCPYERRCMKTMNLKDASEKLAQFF